MAAGSLTLFGIGGATAEDKRRYSLFSPVPEALLRDMSTDRPDTTEVPFTVDAGHFQIETSIFSYARSFRAPDGSVTRGSEWMTSNLRIGLTHNTELSLVGRPYALVRTNGPGGTDRQSGPGGIDVRMKFNLWGNDSFEGPGATAFALLPYVTLPTDRFNGIGPDKNEGGVVAIWATKFNDTYGLGINAAIAAERNTDTSRYFPAAALTFSLSQEITDRIGIYYEAVGRFGINDGASEIITLGSGLTYKVNKNLQLDAGINFGVTRASDRINPFIGISARY